MENKYLIINEVGKIIEIDDYYKVPQRIGEITKDGIVAVSKDMFDEQVWGFGALGNASDDFVKDLHQQIAPLWDSSNFK